MTVNKICDRFRGYLPVVIDVETGGFNCQTDALLELAAVFLQMDSDGKLRQDKVLHFHVEPFAGANIEESSLKFLELDPYHPFRFAKPEREVFTELFKETKQQLKAQSCSRAIVVGHNASFDLSFLQSARHRLGHKKWPFHSFSTLDTATLSALAFGQTVLAKSLAAAGIEFDQEEAHSALYDAEKTAELFCHIVNQWPLVKNPP